METFLVDVLKPGVTLNSYVTPCCSDFLLSHDTAQPPSFSPPDAQSDTSHLLVRSV